MHSGHTLSTVRSLQNIRFYGSLMTDFYVVGKRLYLREFKIDLNIGAEVVYTISKPNYLLECD